MVGIARYIVGFYSSFFTQVLTKRSAGGIRHPTRVPEKVDELILPKHRAQAVI